MTLLSIIQLFTLRVRVSSLNALTYSPPFKRDGKVRVTATGVFIIFKMMHETEVWSSDLLKKRSFFVQICGTMS